MIFLLVSLSLFQLYNYPRAYPGLSTQRVYYWDLTKIVEILGNFGRRTIKR